MYEDDPQEKVFDLLGEAVFGDHPLGRAVIGRAEIVRAVDSEQLRSFHAERYVPENVVIGAAGSSTTTGSWSWRSRPERARLPA